MKQLQIRIT